MLDTLYQCDFGVVCNFNNCLNTLHRVISEGLVNKWGIYFENSYGRCQKIPFNLLVSVIYLI